MGWCSWAELLLAKAQTGAIGGHFGLVVTAVVEGGEEVPASLNGVTARVLGIRVVA
jgi:hypothetical protein